MWLLYYIYGDIVPKRYRDGDKDLEMERGTQILISEDIEEGWRLWWKWKERHGDREISRETHRERYIYGERYRDRDIIWLLLSTHTFFVTLITLRNEGEN